MSEDDPFGDLVPQRLAFPINAPSQTAPGFAPVPPQSAAPVADDLSFDDLIPTQPMPNVWDAVKAGVSSSIHGLGQTAETMRGGKPVAEDANPAAAPLAWSDLASPGSQLAPKIAYRLAEGAPAMAGGITGAIGGGLAGSAVAPGVGTVAGSLAGGTLGTAAVSAAQTLGPYFAQALKESPDKPEEAYTKALHAAELAGVFGGASWALFPVRAFQGPVKQMMFQAFGVQPAVAVAHKASSNVVEGKPVTEDLGQSYAEGATMTALPMAGHALATKALGAVTRPGIRVPAFEERVEPVFDSVGSREVQPVADVGAVIEPAEPVVVKKKRTRPVDQTAADKFAKKAADLTVETQAAPVDPVMAPEVIPPASGPVPFDYASVPRSSDKIAALRAELDASQPDSWHQVALQEALNIGTNPEIAKTSVQWASANNRPDIVRMIIEKADTRARDADLHRHQYPELDYWARRARDDASALREANTGAWAEPNTTPLEAIALGRMPQDMLGFIRDRGGIRDTEGELKAIGARDKTGIINNTSGLHPDEMRRILVEQGYIDDVPHDQQTQSTVNDLYDAVGDALNGRKIYRATDADRADMINRTKVKSSEDEKAEAAIIMQLKKWHRDYEQPYKMTEGDEADIVRRVMDGHDLDTAINDQARDWYNEVYQGIDSRRAPPRGETPVSRGESRDGFEAESRAVEPGTDGAVSGGESGDWWREQNPWSIKREAPSLDIDPNAGANRVREAIVRALHKLPDGVSVKGYGDLGEAPGLVGERAARDQRSAGRRFEGATNAETGDIYIAHHAMNPDATIGHELIHALRIKGLMSDGDLKLLADRAAQIPGLWDQNVYLKAYEGRENVNELMAQEAAAHLYEARIRGQDFGSRINAILDRIKEFIDRVRNGLKGQGFRSAGDVMDAIDSGRMIGRDPRWGDGPAYSMGDEEGMWSKAARSLGQEPSHMDRRMDQDMAARQNRANGIISAIQDGMSSGKPFRISAKRGRMSALVSRSPDQDGFRVTRFVDNEPVSHMDYGLNERDLSQAAYDMAGLGAKVKSEQQPQTSADRTAPNRELDDSLNQNLYSFGDEKPNKNLDMSPSARKQRAEEIGFDTSKVWYVSSLHPIEAFEPHGKFMGRTGLAGISLTDNPAMANRYLERFGDIDYKHQPFQKNVMAVYVKKGAFVERDEPFKSPIGMGSPLPAGYKWPSSLDGVHGVIFNDALNSRGGVKHVDGNFRGAIKGKELVLRDPSMVRSVNAAFDPSQSDSPNLMYSMGRDEESSGSREGGSSRSVGAVNVPAVPRSIDNLGYYSHALEAARGLKQARGTPEQMLAQLRSAGVKQAEIEATGLDKFFAEKQKPQDRSHGVFRGPEPLSPEAGATGTSVHISSASQSPHQGSSRIAISETPEYKHIEGQAVKAFDRDIAENEHKYFKYEYDDHGNTVWDDARDDAFLHQKSAFKTLPALASAINSAARAAGHSLDMAPSTNSGSWYGTLKVAGRPDQKVRLADHGNISSQFDPPVFNINPDRTGMSVDDFLQVLVEQKRPAEKKSPNVVTRHEIASYLEKNRVGVKK